MKANLPKIIMRLGAALAALLAGAIIVAHISGCASPGYYWQAASGHLSLMHARRPVDEAIAEGDEDEAVLEKLRLSQQIMAFARDDLGLPDNGSYSEFVRTDSEAVVWNVVAAPEFSLEAKTWCFPVSGCVPYRGYFDKADAERYAGKLAAEGLDVAISPAIAYSTLGWFKDPLLDTMWRHSDTQLAAYLFHELAHQDLYVKGDANFNESYASFVEEVGVERWLTARGEDETLQRWKDVGVARAEFNALLGRTRESLQQIYQSSENVETRRQEKAAAIQALTGEYQELVAQRWQGHDYFGGWFGQAPNNARFALIDTYEGGSCAFQALYRQAGEDMQRFRERARQQSQLPAEQRREWLDQDCDDEGVAPAAEL